MKIFLREGPKNKYFDCWYFSIFTGVRREEMLGLRFQDTNWEQNSATLFQEVLVNPDKGGGVIFDEDLKTEESAKAIPLTAGLIKILKRRKKVVAQNKLLFGAQYKDHDLVFCKEDGSPINPKTLYNNFKKFTRSIGIEMRYHDLRHNLASLLLAEGYSIKMIQEILRHTTSVITTDLYLHLFPQADNEAVQNLENKLINSG